MSHSETQHTEIPADTEAVKEPSAAGNRKPAGKKRGRKKKETAAASDSRTEPEKKSRPKRKTKADAETSAEKTANTDANASEPASRAARGASATAGRKRRRKKTADTETKRSTDTESEDIIKAENPAAVNLEQNNEAASAEINGAEVNRSEPAEKKKRGRRKKTAGMEAEGSRTEKQGSASSAIPEAGTAVTEAVSTPDVTAAEPETETSAPEEKPVSSARIEEAGSVEAVTAGTEVLYRADSVPEVPPLEPLSERSISELIRNAETAARTAPKERGKKETRYRRRLRFFRELLEAGLKGVILLGLAALIWVVLTPYFRIDRNRDGEMMRAFPSNSIDVLALGSSHMQYAFNPGVFYAESGYYSYVFGSVCQPFSESVYLLEEVLKTQKPEVLVVDVFTLLPQSQVCYADGTYYIAMDMLSGRTRYDSADAIPDTVDPDVKLGYQVDLYMNHDNWKTMDFSDLNSILKNGQEDRTVNWGLGYVDQMPEDPKYTPLEVFEPKEKLELSEREKYWIDRLVNRCRESGIHLIFVKTPYQEDQDDADKLAAVWSYLDEIGAEYIDFLARAKDLEWYLDMDGDTWHNNTWGAEIVTKHLAEVIQSGGYVKHHRQNETTDKVYALSLQRTADYLLTKQNINIYHLLEDAAKYPCITAVRIPAAKTSSIGEYENTALQALGFHHDFIAEKNRPYYGLVKNGQVIQEGNEPFETELEGVKVSFTEEDILFNGASTGQLGEMQIIFCDDQFEWFNPIAIDFSSGHFWKKGCDGWNCEVNP
ncbi:MAG: hypothetical protein IKS32_09840 [Solobacterium sp.]|nr:hypothetical protein [Solobacterium sp.]